MKISFNVQGKPIGQPRQRHRIIAKGNQSFVQNYTPAKGTAAEWKRQVIQAAHDAFKSVLFHGPVSVTLEFVFQVQSKPQTFRTKKPDLDNLAKLVLDAMNGIAYTDDNQVAMLMVTKTETKTLSGVWVKVEELE